MTGLFLLDVSAKSYDAAKPYSKADEIGQVKDQASHTLFT